MLRLHRSLIVLAASFASACPAGGDESTTGSSSTSTSTSPTTGTSDAPTTSGTTSTDTPTTSTTDTPATTTTTDPGTTTDLATSTGSETGDPVVSDCETPPCFNVINKCAFPLWIHAANNDQVVLQPDNVELAPGGVQQYPVPAEWPAGRVNAFYAEPNANPEAHDKVEMTVTGGIMNYNITYVDYVALPSEMQAVGPECQATPEFDPKVGCYVPRDQLLDGCPDDLLTGERCLSASLYCADPAHQALPYCHALDGEIAKCAAQHPETCGVAAQLGNTTRDVYACSGYFDSQPPNCMPATKDCHFEGNKWCAALNRGMLNDPESVDTSEYYQSTPHNTYSKWVHATCPGIYAFAYDDYPASGGESGFRACKAPRLDITFCPAG